MEITPPSDAEITEKLGELVRGADFDAVTVKVLRLQLQQCFSGQDLSHRKAFIKTAIKSIIAQQDAAEAEKEKEEKNADESACSGLSDSSEDEGESEHQKEGDVKPKKRKSTGGFNRDCQLSQALFQFLGGTDVCLPRSEVTKRIWDYVKVHNLKDPKDGRKALCDEALERVFKCKSFTFFSLSKKLSSHMKDMADLVAQQSAPKPKKQKKEEENGRKNASKSVVSEAACSGLSDSSEDEVENGQQNEKNDVKSKNRKSTGGFNRECQLSEALFQFLGGMDVYLPRSEVTKRIWDYVKLHNLKDPKDGRKALCDEALERVFKCKSFTFFTLSKKLSSHMKDMADLVASKSAPKSKKQKKEEIKGSKDEAKGDKGGKVEVKEKKAPKPKNKAPKGPNPLSVELAAICGTDRLNAFQVTKQVWVYIKEHNLQNPSNKREILCDEALEKVMKRKKVSMLKMSKLLQPHILPVHDS